MEFCTPNAGRQLFVDRYAYGLPWRDYPLNHVVLGGDLLSTDSDFILVLKTPDQVSDVATAVPGVTVAEFRRRYFEINQDIYGFPLSEEYFGYTWGRFQRVRDFWLRAASESRSVLFTADQ
jgi:hypothetical protein